MINGHLVEDIDCLGRFIALACEVGLNAFSLLVGLGASCGLAWVSWRSSHIERMPLRQVEHRLNGGFVALAGALVGGRAAFVWLNWAYFQNHPVDIVRIGLGGLGWAGALAGGLAALALYAGLTRASPGALGDGLLPLALCLVVSSWLGCWQAGCAYGPEAAETWWTVPARDEWGQFTYRWPIQLGGALTAVISFWLLEFLRPKLPRSGQLAGLGLLILSAQMLALSLLRADPTILWRGQRVDSWAAFLFLGMAVLINLVAFFPHRAVEHPAPLESLEPNP
jgi:phosphatidylglycerol:prolipoprotein diacylglycerol transferase